VELAKKKPEPVSISILSSVDEAGSVKISGLDFGMAPEDALGIDSYEYWVRLKPEAIAALIQAMLNDRYQDQAHAVRDFRYYCKSKGIPYEVCAWSYE